MSRWTSARLSVTAAVLAGCLTVTALAGCGGGKTAENGMATGVRSELRGDVLTLSQAAARGDRARAEAALGALNADLAAARAAGTLTEAWMREIQQAAAKVRANLGALSTTGGTATPGGTAVPSSTVTPGGTGPSAGAPASEAETSPTPTSGTAASSNAPSPAASTATSTGPSATASTGSDPAPVVTATATATAPAPTKPAKPTKPGKPGKGKHGKGDH